MRTIMFAYRSQTIQPPRKVSECAVPIQTRLVSYSIISNELAKVQLNYNITTAVKTAIYDKYDRIKWRAGSG